MHEHPAPSPSRDDSSAPAIGRFSTWRRWLLCLLAFAGTGAYAGSFLAVDCGEKLFASAAVLGAAAGAAWLAFGLVLWRASRSAGRPGLAEWFDLCLVALRVGAAVQAAGVGLNLAAWRAGFVARLAWPLLVAAHLLLLAAADVLMGAAFVSAARRVGVRPARSALLWVAALNGSYALLLLAALSAGLLRV